MLTDFSESKSDVESKAKASAGRGTEPEAKRLCPGLERAPSACTTHVLSFAEDQDQDPDAERRERDRLRQAGAALFSQYLCSFLRSVGADRGLHVIHVTHNYLLPKLELEGECRSFLGVNRDRNLAIVRQIADMCSLRLADPCPKVAVLSIGTSSTQAWSLDLTPGAETARPLGAFFLGTSCMHDPALVANLFRAVQDAAVDHGFVEPDNRHELPFVLFGSISFAVAHAPVHLNLSSEPELDALCPADSAEGNLLRTFWVAAGAAECPVVINTRNKSMKLSVDWRESNSEDEDGDVVETSHVKVDFGGGGYSATVFAPGSAAAPQEVKDRSLAADGGAAQMRFLDELVDAGARTGFDREAHPLTHALLDSLATLLRAHPHVTSMEVLQTGLARQAFALNGDVRPSVQNAAP